MANTKPNTTGRAGTSGAKTTKAASNKPSATKTVNAAPVEPEDDNASKDDMDGFDEYQAAAELEIKAEAAAEEAEAAAHAALAARAALSQRSKPTPSQSQSSSQPQSSRRRRKKQNAASFGDNDGYLSMMSGLLGNMTSGDWDEDTFDDMTQGVSMVLGSGPAFATLGTMLANSTAQSSVLMNATQMQRQLDMVGLSCTSACVQQLLNMNNGSQDQD